MNGFEIGDLFKFDKMVAPTVLKIVYWLGLAGVAVWAVIALIGAMGMMQYSAATGLGTMLLAVVALVFGTLLWRIIIEIYMVIFSVNERLGEIRDRLPPR